MIFSLILFVGVINAIAAEEVKRENLNIYCNFEKIMGFSCAILSKVTPPPPMHGNFGGTKKEIAATAQKLLNAATPEQTAIFTDPNPLLTEGIKAFNITFSVQAQAYSIIKSSLSSDKPKCDSMAQRRADEIINKARDEQIGCLATFRTKILNDGKGFKDIRDVRYLTLFDAI